MQIERALRTTLRQVFCVNLVGKQCCHLIARYSKRSLYYTCKSAIPREIERPPSRHKILSSSSSPSNEHVPGTVTNYVLTAGLLIAFGC